MARGVTTIAQCDQVSRVIDAPCRTRNQMVDVRFTGGA
jgi:hypothetical protein